MAACYNIPHRGQILPTPMMEKQKRKEAATSFLSPFKRHQSIHELLVSLKASPLNTTTMG
jgi:hypothetical protein